MRVHYPKYCSVLAIATSSFAGRHSAVDAFSTAPSSTAFLRPRRTISSSSSTTTTTTPGLAMADDDNAEDRRYTIPDQPARFARAKQEKNARYLDITTAYDPAYVKGKRVAVTGANRGIGLALSKELVAQGAQLIAIVRKTSDELEALGPTEVVTGIDVTDDAACETIAGQIKGGPLDILVNNAGYFYEPVEKIDSMNFKEQLKMIDICACGPLRVTASVFNGGLLQKDAVVAMITSQGGSVGWRTTQNPDGGDYGHHMSKSAANMGSVLLAQEFKKHGVAVGVLHPGFNKTEMTAKYQEIWEIEGAVDAAEGAKRVVHEIGKITPATTGLFINCEDGLEIPW